LLAFVLDHAMGPTKVAVKSSQAFRPALRRLSQKAEVSPNGNRKLDGVQRRAERVRGTAGLCVAPVLIARIRAEYREGPGLRLTIIQASRFLGLDAITCERAFEELADAGFLSRCSDGTYQQAPGE
jgi:hypothetical protein